MWIERTPLITLALTWEVAQPARHETSNRRISATAKVLSVGRPQRKPQ
jgi:hypothetical protein